MGCLAHCSAGGGGSRGYLGFGLDQHDVPKGQCHLYGRTTFVMLCEFRGGLVSLWAKALREFGLHVECLRLRVGGSWRAMMGTTEPMWGLFGRVDTSVGRGGDVLGVARSCICHIVGHYGRIGRLSRFIGHAQHHNGHHRRHNNGHHHSHRLSLLSSSR